MVNEIPGTQPDKLEKYLWTDCPGQNCLGLKKQKCQILQYGEHNYLSSHHFLSGFDLFVAKVNLWPRISVEEELQFATTVHRTEEMKWQENLVKRF